MRCAHLGQAGRRAALARVKRLLLAAGLNVRTARNRIVQPKGVFNSSCIDLLLVAVDTFT
jgi:hypothetical protein